MYFLEQLLHIFIGSVTGCYFVEIPDIISGIIERRVKTGIQPDGIASKLLDIVEFSDDSRQVPDSVPVAVAERLRIYFIKDCIVQPLRHSVFLLFLSFFWW